MSAIQAIKAEDRAALSRENSVLPSRRVGQNLLFLILAAFVLRIIASGLFLGGLSRGYQGDESSYADLALHIAQGVGFTTNSGAPTSYRGPGLPLLLTLPVALIGPDVIGIRMFMCFVESLLILASYLLLRSVTGSAKLGLIGSAIAIFFPSWLYSSGAVLTDVPTAVLVTLMTWMLIEGHRRESLSWFIGAGLLWGAATLTRAVSLIYGPAMILWLVVMMPDWKRRLTAVLSVTIPFLSMVAPWVIRNTYVHGRFVTLSTQKGIQLYIANNPDATGILAIDQARIDKTLAQRYAKEQYPNEALRDDLFQRDAVQFIRENPWRFAQLCFTHLVEFWKFYSPRVPVLNSLVVIASFGLALPFFLIQAVRCGWRRGPELLFVLIVLCHMAVHVVYGSIVRYRIPIEPLIIAMAITGFCWTVTCFGWSHRKEMAPLGLKLTH